MKKKKRKRKTKPFLRWGCFRFNVITGRRRSRPRFWGGLGLGLIRVSDMYGFVESTVVHDGYVVEIVNWWVGIGLRREEGCESEREGVGVGV